MRVTFRNTLCTFQFDFTHIASVFGRLSFDNAVLADVNECLRGLSSCHYNQVCKNTFGGYVCACPHGYRSDGPGRPCVGKLLPSFLPGEFYDGPADDFQDSFHT